MWRKYNMYRHEKCRDTAMEVIKCRYIREKRSCKLKIQWWNIGACHKPYPMGVFETLMLPIAEYKYWKLMGFGDTVAKPEHEYLG